MTRSITSSVLISQHSLMDSASVQWISLFLHRYFIPIIYVSATIGNVLSAIVFGKKSWRKNVCVFYFNVCLVFNTCYMNSMMLGSIFLYGFNINLLNTNDFTCKLYTYTSFLFSTLFPNVLCLASIDRLLISSRRADTRLYSSKRLAYFSIGISTVAWSVFLTHLLLKVRVQELQPTVFVCFYDRDGIYPQFVSYSSMIINSTFFILMIILSIIAFRNVRYIRAIPREQQRQQIRSMTKKDLQLLGCLFVQVVVYILFSITISVYMVYAAATSYQRRTAQQQAIVSFVNSLSTVLHHIPYCASFPIFYTTSKAFRSEMKRLMCKLIAGKIGHPREDEQAENSIGIHIVDVDAAVSS